MMGWADNTPTTASTGFGGWGSNTSTTTTYSSGNVYIAAVPDLADWEARPKRHASREAHALMVVEARRRLPAQRFGRYGVQGMARLPNYRKRRAR